VDEVLREVARAQGMTPEQFLVAAFVLENFVIEDRGPHLRAALEQNAENGKGCCNGHSGYCNS